MIELLIAQRRRDLGGPESGRVLPFAKRRPIARRWGVRYKSYRLATCVNHKV